MTSFKFFLGLILAGSICHASVSEEIKEYLDDDLIYHLPFGDLIIKDEEGADCQDVREQLDTMLYGDFDNFGDTGYFLNYEGDVIDGNCMESQVGPNQGADDPLEFFYELSVVIQVALPKGHYVPSRSQCIGPKLSAAMPKNLEFSNYISIVLKKDENQTCKQGEESFHYEVDVKENFFCVPSECEYNE